MAWKMPTFKRAILLALADGLPHTLQQIIDFTGEARGNISNVLRRCVDQALVQRFRVSKNSGVRYRFTYRLSRWGYERLAWYAIKEAEMLSEETEQEDVV